MVSVGEAVRFSVSRKWDGGRVAYRFISPELSPAALQRLEKIGAETNDCASINRRAKFVVGPKFN
jgi:hypothetical protein